MHYYIRVLCHGIAYYIIYDLIGQYMFISSDNYIELSD